MTVWWCYGVVSLSDRRWVISLTSSKELQVLPRFSINTSMTRKSESSHLLQMTPGRKRLLRWNLVSLFQLKFIKRLPSGSALKTSGKVKHFSYYRVLAELLSDIRAVLTNMETEASVDHESEWSRIENSRRPGQDSYLHCVTASFAAALVNHKFWLTIRCFKTSPNGPWKQFTARGFICWSWMVLLFEAERICNVFMWFVSGCWDMLPDATLSAPSKADAWIATDV